jgi:hypothetical protein
MLLDQDPFLLPKFELFPNGHQYLVLLYKVQGRSRIVRTEQHPVSSNNFYPPALPSFYTTFSDRVSEFLFFEGSGSLGGCAKRNSIDSECLSKNFLCNSLYL